MSDGNLVESSEAHPMFDMSAWTEFKNPEDRTNAGLKLRERFPLSSHAVWRVQTKRRDVIGLLEEQNKMRVPDLVPLRFKRMSANAFTFYRGARRSWRTISPAPLPPAFRCSA